MFEWNDETRHWWRYDKNRAAMIHRVSGEIVIYRGSMLETGWHRFDYEHEDVRYPLIVEIKMVRYPNPEPEALNMPPWNTGSMPFLEQRLWHVDHKKSLEAWRQEVGRAEDLPPYWLWHRADVAISEAGLLWPERQSVPHAEEIALNAGWANGQWREHFYRRVSWKRPLFSLVSLFRKSVGGIIALPLSDHFLTPKDATSPSWDQVVGRAVDATGVATSGRALRMESSDGMVLTKPIDASVRFGSPRVQPLTSLWADQYLTTAIACVDRSGVATRELVPAARWHVPLSGYCAIGRVGSRAGAESILPDGKRLVTRKDIFSARKEMWTYDANVVDGPISSLSAWRPQFEARINALPFSTGFELEAAQRRDLQGEIGTVEVFGGFIGGLQGMNAQVRLSAVVKSDSADFDWRRFFS